VQRQSSVVDKTREKCKKVEAGGSSHVGLYRLTLRDCPRKSAVTGGPERFRAQIAPHCGHKKLSALHHLRAPTHKTCRGTRTQKQSGDCRPSVAYGLDRVLEGATTWHGSPRQLRSMRLHRSSAPPSTWTPRPPRRWPWQSHGNAAGERTSALPNPLQSMEPLSQSLCPPAPNLVTRPSALRQSPLPSTKTNHQPTTTPTSSHPSSDHLVADRPFDINRSQMYQPSIYGEKPVARLDRDIQGEGVRAVPVCGGLFREGGGDAGIYCALRRAPFCPGAHGDWIQCPSPANLDVNAVNLASDVSDVSRAAAATCGSAQSLLGRLHKKPRHAVADIIINCFRSAGPADQRRRHCDCRKRTHRACMCTHVGPQGLQGHPRLRQAPGAPRRRLEGLGGRA